MGGRLVKIWQMSEYDWVAAETLEEAKDCLSLTLGCETPEELEEYLDDPRELTEAELDEYEFCDSDEDGNPNPEVGKRSFREELARQVAAGTKFPCYFAGTE